MLSDLMAHAGIDINDCISFDDVAIDLQTAMDNAQEKRGREGEGGVDG
jgi:hypothetical protein